MEALYVYVAKSLEKIRQGREHSLTSREAESGFKSAMGLREMRTVPLWRAVFAEFLAQILFMFLLCLSTTSIGDDIVGMSFTSGLALMAAMQIVGHVSGGHINPAVTVARVVVMEVSVIRGILYVIAQCLGAVLGAIMVKDLVDPRFKKNLGVTSVKGGLNYLQGFLLESLLTFVLVSVILATTDPNRLQFGNQSIVIGLTYTLGHLSAMSYTGSSMNPSRSLGSAFAMDFWDGHWIYWLGPILGGMVAAVVYKFLLTPHFASVSLEKDLLFRKDINSMQHWVAKDNEMEFQNEDFMDQGVETDPAKNYEMPKRDSEI